MSLKILPAAPVDSMLTSALAKVGSKMNQIRFRMTQTKTTKTTIATKTNSKKWMQQTMKTMKKKTMTTIHDKSKRSIPKCRSRSWPTTLIMLET